MAKVKKVYGGPAAVFNYEDKAYKQGDEITIDEAVAKFHSTSKHGNHLFLEPKKTSQQTVAKDATS